MLVTALFLDIKITFNETYQSLFFAFMLFIEVYSVVLISALQQGDSVTYMYLCMYIVCAYMYIYIYICIKNVFYTAAGYAGLFP